MLHIDRKASWLPLVTLVLYLSILANLAGTYVAYLDGYSRLIAFGLIAAAINATLLYGANWVAMHRPSR